MNRRHFPLAFVGGLAAQENAPPPPPPDDTPLFRTGTSLAPVRFHVVRDKRYVSDLKAQDIVLLEDGQPRPITFFEGGVTKRSAPIEVILLFDISGSVTYQGFLDPILYRAALLEGLPTVRMSVYGFARRLHRFSGPTRDQTQIAQAFARLENGPRPKAIPLSLPPKRKHPDGGSWIYPAVMGAMRDAAATPHDGPLTRLMLVLSDGFETTDARPEDAAGLANELGIPVFPLALGSRLLKEKLRTARGEMQRAKLETKQADLMEYASLGELTGGRSFEPLQTDATSVREILRFLAAQVMFEYVAGFVPEPGEGTPKKHKLQVKLANKDAGKIIGGTRTILH